MTSVCPPTRPGACAFRAGSRSVPASRSCSAGCSCCRAPRCWRSSSSWPATGPPRRPPRSTRSRRIPPAGRCRPADGRRAASPTGPDPAASGASPIRPGRRTPTRPRGPHPPGEGGPDGIALRLVQSTARAVQETALHQMLLWSTIGLVIMTVLVVLTGRWLAGRALRPVAKVTGTALRISETSLDQRLGLTGPDDELHRLADAFDSMLDRLQQSFDSQRRFVANASHELRTRSRRNAPASRSVSPTRSRTTSWRPATTSSPPTARPSASSPPLLLLARSDRGWRTRRRWTCPTSPRRRRAACGRSPRRRASPCAPGSPTRRG
ncbi:HAMP domain-containing protein [Streptomyces sp. M19]